MAFFKNLKKSLGFENSDEEFEYQESYVDIKKKDTHKPIAKTSVSMPIVTEPHDSVDYEKMKHDIFAGVLNIFNESLPDFLKSSIDADAQKKYLFDALDSSLQSYINNIGVESQRVCESKWQTERTSLINQINELKKINRDIESSKEEYKRQQLSADRQKRALATRIQDLESKVANFEAEKEQYELENRSLVNKLKATNVVERDVEELRLENVRLQEQLKNIISSQSPSDVIVDTTNSELLALQQQNNELLKQVEQMKLKEEMSDAMINELNAKASISIKQVEELEQEKQSLATQLTAISSQLKDNEKELKESKQDLEIVEQIQEEMSKFEAIKAKKDEKIGELQQEIQHLRNQINELEQESESLKSTIEQNLYNQAISEDLLKKEINQLKEVQKNAPQKKAKKKNIQSSVKISAIDESIIDADWLISIPPEGTNTRPTPSTGVEDFGYQAPPKKTTPENEAQMSLW